MNLQEFKALPMSQKKQVLQEDFEKAFGKDSNTRNAKQWQALVNQYGIETVMATEKMTKEEVEARCKETYSQWLKRQFKNKSK